jgi:hypothetical protein
VEQILGNREHAPAEDDQKNSEEREQAGDLAE